MSQTNENFNNVLSFWKTLEGLKTNVDMNKQQDNDFIDRNHYYKNIKIDSVLSDNEIKSDDVKMGNNKHAEKKNTGLNNISESVNQSYMFTQGQDLENDKKEFVFKDDLKPTFTDHISHDDMFKSKSSYKFSNEYYGSNLSEEEILEIKSIIREINEDYTSHYNGFYNVNSNLDEVSNPGNSYNREEDATYKHKDHFNREKFDYVKDVEDHVVYEVDKNTEDLIDDDFFYFFFEKEAFNNIHEYEYINDIHGSERDEHILFEYEGQLLIFDKKYNNKTYNNATGNEKNNKDKSSVFDFITKKPFSINDYEYEQAKKRKLL